VLIARTDFEGAGYNGGERRATVKREIISKLNTLPGVQVVGASTHLPLADERGIAFRIEGRDPNEFHNAASALVSEDYFRAMGIPLLRGRAFTVQDMPNVPNAAVINESLARTYWPHENP